MTIELGSLQQLAHAWLPVLLDAAVKGMVLLAVAGLAVAAMRKTSAAARQLVWVLALAALPALPLASRALPAWRVLPGWATLQTASPQPGTVANVSALPVDSTAGPQENADPGESPSAIPAEPYPPMSITLPGLPE